MDVVPSVPPTIPNDAKISRMYLLSYQFPPIHISSPEQGSAADHDVSSHFYSEYLIKIILIRENNTIYNSIIRTT